MENGLLGSDTADNAARVCPNPPSIFIVSPPGYLVVVVDGLSDHEPAGVHIDKSNERRS
jgi:hypothetical protein